MAHTRGNPVTPLRSEGYAVLAWLVFLNKFCEFHDIHSSVPILPFTDCTKLLPYMTSSATHNAKPDPTRADYDVTESIHTHFIALSKRFPNIRDGAHVRSHQKPPYNDRESWLNHRCDTMARSQLSHTLTPYSDVLPQGRVSIVSETGAHTSNETTVLRWRWRSIIPRQWFTTKFDLSTTTTNSIHWAALSSVHASAPLYLQRFATKLYIRWLPTATRLQLFGHELATCPFCPQDETNVHLLHCPARYDHYISQHQAFTLLLASLHTPSDIIKPLADSILYWQTHGGSAPTFNTDASNRAQRCLRSQRKIGWRLATCGVMSSTWSNTIPDPKHLNLGTRWQTKISRWLLDAAYLTWTLRNKERHRRDAIDALTAQDRETEANVRKVFNLAHTYLSIYDQAELMYFTLDEQLTRPEPTNRIWAQQQLRIIYRRLRLNDSRPILPDIRQHLIPTPRLQTHHPTAPDTNPTT